MLDFILLIILHTKITQILSDKTQLRKPQQISSKIWAPMFTGYVNIYSIQYNLYTVFYHLKVSLKSFKV